MTERTRETQQKRAHVGATHIKGELASEPEPPPISEKEDDQQSMLDQRRAAQNPLRNLMKCWEGIKEQVAPMQTIHISRHNSGAQEVLQEQRMKPYEAHCDAVSSALGRLGAECHELVGT